MKRKLFQVHNSPKNGCYGKLKDAMTKIDSLAEYNIAHAHLNGKRKKTVGGTFTARNGATITVVFAEVVTAAKIDGQLIGLQ